MLTLLAYAHVFVGLLLILFVLLQDPKGGAAGVFGGGGGSSNTFFGSSGASNFLTTATKWLGALFAVSCLTLTYLSAKHGGSVMDNLVPASNTAPATPGAAGTPATAPATQGKPAPAPAAPAQPAGDKK